VTINKIDRPIYDLGDGVQNLIILLYPIFFHANQSLLCFIEEPEISLHPGMQRLFIDTIMREEFTNVQFFITTHSNHFLDMTLDHGNISIYNFQRQQAGPATTFSVTNTQNEDIKLLDTLGVRNSSMFISNCTVWVEGVTDRLYLNRYMDLLQQEEFLDNYETKRLKEDLHFSYIEYGGANLVHYAFDDEEQWEKIQALKISSKILLVMDDDGASQDGSSFKHTRIQELKQQLGDRLVVLPCREIENTLSAEVLKSVIQKKEGKVELTFPSFTEESYKNIYLGDFIHQNVTGIKKNYRVDKGTGTISDKVGFCRRALEEIKSVNDLSASAINVGRQILSFIRTQNN
jgi:predicted ATP-dependent endonuclease of OLD family